jgi:hypothetical protein
MRVYVHNLPLGISVLVFKEILVTTDINHESRGIEAIAFLEAINKFYSF